MRNQRRSMSGEAGTVTLSRRSFLRFGTLGAGGLLLAACGVQTQSQAAAPTATVPSAATAVPAGAAEEEIQILARDVIDFVLDSDEWSGMYGSVTFQMHAGRYNGETIYYIRTDASDQAFANAIGLTYVPLLNQGRDIAKPIYLFDDERPAVLSTAPGEAGYLSLFQIRQISLNDESLELTTAADVEQAIADGAATVAENSIFVNYPIVQWPGGALAVDEEKTETLGTGQLMAAPDTENMTVTFKLHQCFPGSRYILTDTSAAPMAPMMSVPASEPTRALMDSGGTDEIWIFVNGIAGSGVAGFQPAVFDNKAGQPAWSPFWNHFALRWTDESQARVIRDSAEIRELVADGTLEQFNGVPDSHPNGFVVNCPAPILAPNDFQG